MTSHFYIITFLWDAIIKILAYNADKRNCAYPKLTKTEYECIKCECTWGLRVDPYSIARWSKRRRTQDWAIGRSLFGASDLWAASFRIWPGRVRSPIFPCAETNPATGLWCRPPIGTSHVSHLAKATGLPHLKKKKILFSSNHTHSFPAETFKHIFVFHHLRLSQN